MLFEEEEGQDSKGKEQKIVQLLWDRPHVLWGKAQTASESSDTLSSFLLKLGQIQSEFGNSLRSLTTEFENAKFPEGASLLGGWKTLLEQTEELGKEFSSIGSLACTNAQSEELMKLRNFLDAPVEKFQENISLATKTLIDNEKQLVKMESEFRRKQKTPEQTAMHKRLQQASQASDHALGVTVLDSLEKFRELDTQRVNLLREFLQKTVSSHNNTFQVMYKSSLINLRKVRAVSYTEDLESLIKEKGSGFACPWIEDSDESDKPQREVKKEESILSGNTTTIRSKGIKLSTQTIRLNTITPMKGQNLVDTLDPLSAQTAKFGTMRGRSGSRTPSKRAPTQRSSSPDRPSPYQTMKANSRASLSPAVSNNKNSLPAASSPQQPAVSNATKTLTNPTTPRPSPSTTPSTPSNAASAGALTSANITSSLSNGDSVHESIADDDPEIEAAASKAVASLEVNAHYLEQAALEAREQAFEAAMTAHDAAALLLSIEEKIQIEGPSELSVYERKEAQRIVADCEAKMGVAKDAANLLQVEAQTAVRQLEAAKQNARKRVTAEILTKRSQKQQDLASSTSSTLSVTRAPSSSSTSLLAAAVPASPSSASTPRKETDVHNKPQLSSPPPPPVVPSVVVIPASPRSNIHDDAEKNDYLNDSTKGDASVSTGALEEAADQSMRVPIVIDNGSAYFKAGFAGNAAPSLVVSSTVAAYPKTEFVGSGEGLAHLIGSSSLHVGPHLGAPPSFVEVNDLVFSDDPKWEDVELAWDYLFSKLSDNCSSHPVLMTIPAMAPLKLKSTMQEILYEKFGIQELFVAEAPLLTPYAYGCSTGLVVEVGHSSAQIVPVVDGCVLGAYSRRVKYFGGFADTQRIVNYFTANTTADELELSKYSTVGHVYLMAQAIKDRLCACSLNFSAYEDEHAVMEDVQEFLGGREPGEGDLLPKRPHSVTLHRALLTCGEMLFSPNDILQDDDASILSIQKLCAKVVSACDVDSRTALLENVCLSGQVTTMPGFLERLQQELRLVIPYAHTVKVHGQARRYGAWVGGAVLSCLEEFQPEWRTYSDWEDERSG